MKTTEFNKNYELDRKAKGVRANPKHAATEPPEIMTADAAAYDPTETYYFFDVQTAEIRGSLGLRRDGEYLWTFGLKVVAIEKLRLCRDDALAEGQTFFKSEIERLRKRIADFELEKKSENRSLKSFLSVKQ